MDLKDLVKKYVENGEEAFRALNAGHPETSEILLKQNEKLIKQYFDEKTTPAGDVTESATKETADEVPQEKPAEVPGAALPATQFAPGAAAQKIGTGSAEPKPPQ